MRKNRFVFAPVGGDTISIFDWQTNEFVDFGSKKQLSVKLSHLRKKERLKRSK